jgi:multidrug efflux pump subunit AcrA (membrane-fusion protein)
MTPFETRSLPEAKRAKHRRRAFLSRRVLVVGVIAVLLIVVASLASTRVNKPAQTAPATSASATLAAHGTIEPAAQATIATMNGGVVKSLAVRVGQVVGEQQKIAEVSLPGQTEILVAPWRGTITGLSARLGDTLMPGAVVATIGDLSRYQVETTDVDEYLIGQIHPDQQVTMTVEALDGRQLKGTVDTVALTQQTSSAGVTNYPVVIRISDNDPDIRPGMTVRIVFSPSAGP